MDEIFFKNFTSTSSTVDDAAQDTAVSTTEAVATICDQEAADIFEMSSRSKFSSFFLELLMPVFFFFVKLTSNILIHFER